MTRAGDWMQTAYGRQYWPSDPRSHEVFIDDIAHALAMLCRFGGHCLRFYSVAEHSVHVARAAPKPYKLWGLLHDAPEAYVTDVISPLKPFVSGYREIEEKNMRAIELRFNLHLGMPPIIKQIDRRVLVDEARQNMRAPPVPWKNMPEPLGVTLQFWSPERARAEFLAEFERLTNA